jgi:hypothetical protein
MAATMNGIALHGGLIPYGGTFLCFSDYCRPAIRLAAMMDIRTIFVMTHDSIGLREDGPTHQPMPLLRREAGIENRSARGAYVLIEAEDGPRKVTLMATGSELRLAVEARAVLQQEGIPTAVRAVHLDLQRAGCGIPAGGAWRHPSPGGGRGCSADELGSLPRLAGVLCRHARVRRIREDLPMSTRSSTSPPKRWCAPPARV